MHAFACIRTCSRKMWQKGPYGPLGPDQSIRANKGLKVRAIGPDLRPVGKVRMGP